MLFQQPVLAVSNSSSYFSGSDRISLYSHDMLNMYTLKV